MKEEKRKVLVDNILKYGELKSSLGKAEQIQWKNEMTELAIKELKHEINIVLSEIDELLKGD